MSQPVALLLITWNRRAYVEKMLPTLFNNKSEFELYWWDNASQDGTRDVVNSIDDSRLVKKYFCEENAGQYEPFMWFLENASNELVGKVDDDILLPEGWIEQIAPILPKDPRFGMLGCWVFMVEDWNEKVAEQNVIEVAGHRIFRTMGVAGHSFLARREYLLRYGIKKQNYHYGIPVDRTQMTIDGLISGQPLPILFAHNMDDPRSPFNTVTKSGSLQSSSALSARMRGFESAEAYANWIAEDARNQQEIPFAQQLEWVRARKKDDPFTRAKRALKKLFS